MGNGCQICPSPIAHHCPAIVAEPERPLVSRPVAAQQAVRFWGACVAGALGAMHAGSPCERCGATP